MSESFVARPVAVIAGVGPGNGQALAQAFAGAGYAVALLARSAERVAALAQQLDGAKAYACDVGDAQQVAAVFANIRAEMGEVDVLVFNAGSMVFGDALGVTPEQFQDAWRINTLGGLLCAQQVLPAMIEKGRGDIVFIGATASLRGGVQTAAFAPAKAAQRSLAQSMARSYWPKGVHVALVIIDGIVDTPFTRKFKPDLPPEAFVTPHGVAEVALALTRQNRQAWSFEVEARPFLEKW